MARKSAEIELTTTFDLIFDDQSPEFKEALDSYKSVICKSCGIDDMLKQVAFSINRYGAERMIEGVGYVATKNNPKEKIEKGYWSGITVVDDSPLTHTEIISINKYAKTKI